MNLRNTDTSWGAVAIGVHWIVALAVAGLFGLGLWMVELNYYSPWYHDAPAIHKAVGILVLLAMAFRVLWRFTNATPEPLPSLSRFEIKASEAVHGILYLLIFAVLVTGYLISTAADKPVEVFGLFSVPALISGLPNQEDVAGEVHEWLAYGLAAFVGLHAAAALKHHFVDRDATLRRMLGL